MQRKVDDFCDIKVVQCFLGIIIERSTEHTYRLFGKLTQKFGSAESNSEENSQLLLKMLFLLFREIIQITNILYGDANHKDDVFNYGYVGKFKTYKAPTYGFGTAC